MKYIVKAPDSINAEITLPASKSISNRALVISAMSHAMNGDSMILPDNLSDCDDTDVIVSALRDMPDVIDIKAAGTAMRFMTAYLCVCNGEEHTITGTERMQHRPIKTLVDALRQLGASIEYVGEEGYPPLRITGRRLNGGRLAIPGNVSSQYISALLMIGPMLAEGLTLTLSGEIVSRPYIDLTLCTMRDFGAEASWIGVDTIHVSPKAYVSCPYYIESDWSASSYWYQIMALYCNEECSVILNGLMDGSRQGDSQVRYMFSLLGMKSLHGDLYKGQTFFCVYGSKGRMETTREDVMYHANEKGGENRLFVNYDTVDRQGNLTTENKTYIVPMSEEVQKSGHWGGDYIIMEQFLPFSKQLAE